VPGALCVFATSFFPQFNLHCSLASLRSQHYQSTYHNFSRLLYFSYLTFGIDTSSSWVSSLSVIHNCLFLQSLESPGSSFALSTTNANDYKIGCFTFVYPGPRRMLIHHWFIDAYNDPHDFKARMFKLSKKCFICL
jgi:hypothetical protein